MSVIEKILPSYSTERYYLLSELEDICGKPLEFIEDEDNTQSCAAYWKSNPIKDNMHVVVYIRWNYSDGHYALHHAMLDMLGDPKSTDCPTANCVVVVDVIVSENSEDGFYSAKNEITAHLLILQEMFTVRGIIFGVTNVPAAVPGLEAALEYLTDICSHEVENSTMRVVAKNNMDYVGGDPLSEPDAVSGVLQYVLSSIPFSWMETAQPDNVTETQDSQEASKSDIDNHSEFTGINIVMFFLVACVAYVIYLWLENKKE